MRVPVTGSIVMQIFLAAAPPPDAFGATVSGFGPPRAAAGLAAAAMHNEAAALAVMAKNTD
jgi:hypothetical protein